MSEQTPAPSKRNFKRSLSGKGIIIIMLIILAFTFFLGKIISEFRWNSYLAANQPTISFKEIIRDLQAYEKKNKEFPKHLNLDVKDYNWRWAVDKQGKKPVVEETGISKTGNRAVSRFQYKNYEYLYADVGNIEIGPMAVMWAVPVWKPLTLPLYLEYTGHQDELNYYLEQWLKEKKTIFVIITDKKTFVWDGVLPPQEKGTAGLERVLEPTPDWLEKNGLKQNFVPGF